MRRGLRALRLGAPPMADARAAVTAAVAEAAAAAVARALAILKIIMWALPYLYIVLYSPPPLLSPLLKLSAAS